MEPHMLIEMNPSLFGKFVQKLRDSHGIALKHYRLSIDNL